ncbi:MAG: Trm112 family protein [Caulobacterales bacterium]|jgi:uncharacterized protein YbaR (Trm112 family)
MSDPIDDAPVLDPRLLEVLVCPHSRTRLRYDRAKQELVSPAARLAYPIKDGVPVLIIDEARELGPDE